MLIARRLILALGVFIGRLQDSRTHMKKATVLFIGLNCIVLFGFSAKAGRFGDRLRRPSDSPGTVVAREWRGRVASTRRSVLPVSP
jgi:hypothetical protein